MYAGKSSELIRRLMIYHEMEMKVLYVNSSKDVRTPHTFSTHNGTIGDIPYDQIKTDNLTSLKVDSYEVIGIDEAQLFDDLKDMVLKWVDTQSKIVIVCGLNGDFRRLPFGQVNNLVSYCDTITKLAPFCLPCKQNYGVVRRGPFTKRTTTEQSTVLIGGKDSYIPACRKCFLRKF